MKGRLLTFQSGESDWNMAVDQALLESCQQNGVPVLRLYGWRHPTLTLGYFQSLSDRDTHASSRSVGCIRRSTGGGAIVHHHELTYSISLPIPVGKTKYREELYMTVHGAIIRVLAQFGISATANRLRPRPAVTTEHANRDEPFLCFQRRTDEDLIVSGYKIAGSAQRRTRHAVLQHGSLLLKASQYAPELPGVADLAAARIDLGPCCAKLTTQLEECLGVRWVASQLSDQESSAAIRIRNDRFHPKVGFFDGPDAKKTICDRQDLMAILNTD